MPESVGENDSREPAVAPPEDARPVAGPWSGIFHRRGAADLLELVRTVSGGSEVALLGPGGGGFPGSPELPGAAGGLRPPEERGRGEFSVLACDPPAAAASLVVRLTAAEEDRLLREGWVMLSPRASERGLAREEASSTIDLRKAWEPAGRLLLATPRNRRGGRGPRTPVLCAAVSPDTDPEGIVRRLGSLAALLPGPAPSAGRLQEVVGLFERVLRDMQLGVTVTDLEGVILFANPAMEAMHGYGPGELTGRRSAILGAPERRTGSGLPDMEEGSSWTRESVNVRKNGERFPVLLWSDLVRERWGGPVGVVTCTEDITGRKAAREAVRPPWDAGDGGGASRGDSHAEPVSAGGHPTRPDPGRRPTGSPGTVIGLNELVGEVGQALVGAADGVELVVETGARPDGVAAARADVVRILGELVSNALAAMSDGGRLVLRTSNVTLEPSFTAGEPRALPGPFVLLAVADTGHGMPEEIRHRIFEPRFTTRADPGRAGLGLPTVRRLVTGLGGLIRVRSGEGQGSVFEVFIPAAPGA